MQLSFFLFGDIGDSVVCLHVFVEKQFIYVKFECTFPLFFIDELLPLASTGFFLLQEFLPACVTRFHLLHMLCYTNQKQSILLLGRKIVQFF